MAEHNSQQNTSGPEMLTIAEVARLLRVHPNSVRRWANQGLIKVYRVGKRGDRRFKSSDLAAFLGSWEASKGSGM